MRLKVQHTTRYQYSEPVSQSVNEVCLIPRATRNQLCESSVLDIKPAPDFLETRQDLYGNIKSHFSIDAPHVECTITATSYIDAKNESADGATIERRVHSAESGSTKPMSEALMAEDCLLPSPYIAPSAALDEFIDELDEHIDFDQSVAAVAGELTGYIYSHFTYDPNFSTVVTPLEQIIESKRGVCQDFAHLGIAVLREKSIAARYVSGYLETIPPPGQQKLQGADASHAWFSVFTRETGWTDFDPTNNKQPDQSYVTTSWGRDYADVAPLRGVVTGGGSHRLSVAVDVERSTTSAL